MPVIWNNGRKGVKTPAVKKAEEPKSPVDMTVKELKAELEKLGVEFDAKLKKAELVDVLVDALTAAED